MTGIQWTNKTWNPTTGCDRISPGCDLCYALTMAKRLKAMGQAKYQRDGDPRTSGPGFGLTVHESVLHEPLRWHKPARVFVNSMSDLFHDSVPDDFIAQVWAVMAQASQHSFQILTKRHGRLRSLLSSDQFRVSVAELVRIDDGLYKRELAAWPLPHVWLGASVEDQKRADLRIPALLKTSAAVRFLSMEPLIGPVDLAFDHECGDPPHMYCPPVPNWIIVGGESGSGSRPCELEWFRDIIKQCRWSGIPVFVKQLGSVWARANGAKDGKGGDPTEWPEDLRIREFPAAMPW